MPIQYNGSVLDEGGNNKLPQTLFSRKYVTLKADWTVCALD